MRILIIDDDEQVIRLARFALGHGQVADVAAATSGVEGLQIAARQPLDLILLDVMMPGLDGFAVMAALRANVLTRDIPVIFLTAKDRPDQIAALLRTGALGVIRKPFVPARLGDQIREKFGAAKTQSASMPVPAELRQNFLISAGERLEEMDRSIDVLQREPESRAHLRALASQFHRLAGTSASYGLESVSDVARHAEEECDAVTASDRAPGAELLDRWRDRVREMRDHVSAAGTEIGAKGGRARARAIRVLCAGNSPGLEESLRVVESDSAFAVELAANGADARAIMERSLPDVLIVAAGLSDQPALLLVEWMRTLPHGHRPAVLVNAQLRPTTRELKEADALSVDGFVDPRNVEHFLATLRILVDRKYGLPPRVLCVGVEKYASSFASVIESAGYNVRVAEDSEYIDADLERFDPDLMLLGIDDDGGEGLQLVRRVRMMVHPATCPIIVIAMRDVADLPLSGRRAGAADVLRVPLSRALLLSTIENRVVTARACKHAMQRDPLTGCLRDAYFRERLQQRLNGGRGSRGLTLAVVEAKSKSATDDAPIVSLADFLRTRLRDTDEIARVGHHRFVVAMEGIDERNAHALFARFLDEYSRSDRWFQVGIALEANDHSAKDWIARAVKSLERERVDVERRTISVPFGTIAAN